ncbi:acyl carrier protein [Flavobacterium sp. K5-23]|uniref:acyl carrier protein n=1 Tax=Flavobacterium sp. K5-23 TaxID=2746225 RepID=UPI00200FBB95|nr:acyl carrier protein [Flavobacterium sp. K5-23]UQD56988.1 acyl carrier protein [Flavobacterium sp. K5-23]
MNKEETTLKLKSIIKPYIKNEEAYESLTDDTDFITDLNINSANLVDVILDIEDAFGIIIDNQSMQNMLDVKSTLLIIETKLSEK